MKAKDEAKELRELSGEALEQATGGKAVSDVGSAGGTQFNVNGTPGANQYEINLYTMETEDSARKKFQEQRVR